MPNNRIFISLWVINENTGNASSRKLENRKWSYQPLVHTVWTRGWENPVPVSQLPGKDTFIYSPFIVYIGPISKHSYYFAFCWARGKLKLEGSLRGCMNQTETLRKIVYFKQNKTYFKQSFFFLKNHYRNIVYSSQTLCFFQS